MQEMIDERKLEKAGEYNDLFSNLVAASDEEVDPRAKLTDQELISQFFPDIIFAVPDDYQVMCTCSFWLVMKYIFRSFTLVIHGAHGHDDT